MKIGITQYTAQASGIELIDETLRLGLAGCEPMIADPQSEYLQWDLQRIAGFKKYAADKKVSIPAVGNAIFTGHDGLVNSDKSQDAFDLLTRSIEFTAQVGADIMMLCNFFASNPDTPQKKEHTLELLKKIVPVLNQSKVKIALESPINADDFIDMLDCLESEYFGVYYDTGNAIYLGFDPAEEILKLGDRILSIHVKDTVSMLGDSHIGFGRCDWAEIWSAINKINYDGWIILETPFGDEEKIRADIEKIKEQL